MKRCWFTMVLTMPLAMAAITPAGAQTASTEPVEGFRAGLPHAPDPHGRLVAAGRRH